MDKKLITKIVFIFGFGFLSAYTSAQHTNVVIGTKNSPNEPSICINPKNTKQLVAGSNIANLYTSEDGGVTWTESVLQSPHGVWGDPIITVDTAGNFYFLHLSNPLNGNWIDRIVCQRRNAGGQTWSDGGYAGLNGTKAQDKHSVVVDKNTNYLHITWTEFDNYGSFSPQDSSRILYSRSTDLGDTWSTPVKLNKVSGDCIDSGNTTEGAVPAIGPNGEIYVCWTGPAGIVFDRSTDGGNTWLDNDIHVSDHPGGWDFEIPGISRSNGLPFMVCDLSGGPHHGNIYINWADQRNGKNDTDVWLVVSEDSGNTWSAPKRVNNDGTGKQQFFSSMTIDPVTGYLWFVFYDRRNHSDNQTDVYMAVLKDGGNTFKNFKISESPFLPNSGIFFGDYTFVTAYNNIVRPAWTRLHNGKLSNLTALVDVNTSSVNEISNSEDQPVLSPNPATQTAYYSFKLHRTEHIKVHLMNSEGKLITTLKSGSLPAGSYIEEIDTNKLQLQPGIYFIEKQLGKYTKTSKLIITATK